MQDSVKFSITNDGAVTMPLQPAFLVTKTSNRDNLPITDDEIVAFDTEVFDQNADFASNTFTAPVTGKYFLNATIRFDTFDTAADYYILKIETSNRNYIKITNPKFPADGNFLHPTSTVLADMDAGDTATIQVNQSGGTAQTDVIGNGQYTNFSGYLVA